MTPAGLIPCHPSGRPCRWGLSRFLHPILGTHNLIKPTQGCPHTHTYGWWLYMGQLRELCIAVEFKIPKGMRWLWGKGCFITLPPRYIFFLNWLPWPARIKLTSHSIFCEFVFGFVDLISFSYLASDQIHPTSSTRPPSSGVLLESSKDAHTQIKPAK